MARTLRCDCGFVAEGESDRELVESARAHARDAHNVELGAEQILALAKPAAVCAARSRKTTRRKKL